MPSHPFLKNFSLRSVIVPLATLLGVWLGFANPLYQLPLLSLLFPAGLCAVAYKARTGKQAFWRGFGFGLLVYAACLYWLALPVHNYGYLPWAIASVCPFLLAAPLAAYSGLFSLGVRLVRPCLAWPMMFVFIFAWWGALEYVRGWFLTGFPWLTLTSAFVPWPSMIQLSSVIGGYALSGLFAAIAFLFVLPITPQGKNASNNKFIPALLGIVLLGIVFGYGLYRFQTFTYPAPSNTISLIQGNINQAQKWDNKFQHSTVRRYAILSKREATKHQPQLIIWPETAMPFYFQEIAPISTRVRELAAETHTPILVGAPAYRPKLGAVDEYEVFNRAYLLDASGNTLDWYDKEHLVPFGEYVPLSEYLTFLGKLVQGVGDFRPGEDSTPLRVGDLALGMLICYEAIFPELAQKRVQHGANLLVNTSNDAWYGRSSAARQHLHLCMVRAVEQGRYFTRATNTGITAIVDPRGVILAESKLFSTQAITGKIAPVTTLTVFHKIYLGIFPALLAIVLALAMTARLRYKRHNNQE